MAGFAFVCPHARPDENGAHDINDVMAVEGDANRVLVCTRCGQAVPLDEAIAATRQDPDRNGGER